MSNLCLPLDLPIGLRRRQMATLTHLAEGARSASPTELQAEVRAYLSRVKQSRERQWLINTRLLETMLSQIDLLAEDWSAVPEPARYWLKGAFRYITQVDDEDHDSESPIGFEDDVEVLNACLAVTEFDHLRIDVEAFDQINDPPEVATPKPVSDSSTGREFATGMRVRCRDADWLVTRVRSVSAFGEGHQAVHCVGTDALVRGHERVFLTQLDTIEPVDPGKTILTPDDSHGYRLSRLFLEAQLRRMPVTDPEPDLERIGAVTPLGYQKEAVHRALSGARPRLLLADDVGLGKTIEVGMILTELIRRGRADRILVLTKKSMLNQFQAELWNRFAVPLVRLDSTGLAKLRLRVPASKNPFEIYHRIIISLDTLKDVGRYRHFLEKTRWDVVVIDEAHNVAGASVPERNYSYRLARLLAGTSDALLLTTATPHNGRRETFGRLISLLEPSAIPDPRWKEYTADDVRPYFLMRFKEDVRHEAPADFADRIVIPREATRGDATEAEEQVYRRLAELRLNAGSDRLLEYELYKLFLSSPEACLSTANHRLKRLSAAGENSEEQAALKRVVDLLSGLSIRQTTRFQVLLRQLKQLGWNGKKDSPRAIIFTESRLSQDALLKAIAAEFKLSTDLRPEVQAKQVVAMMHGGMPDTCQNDTVEAFGTGDSPMRLLIATDVASEGINLHHQCHHVIHWDLPWSIIRLIQRNGRVGRFGQKYPPEIRYLMVRTRDGLLSGDEAIFERLIEKVEEINRSTRSGASVLRLYDPDREEQYVAERGILKGDLNVLEQPAASELPGESALDDLDAWLRGAATAPAPAAPRTAGAAPNSNSGPPAVRAETSRLRMMSDRSFLLDGYSHLRSTDPELPPLEVDLEQIRLTPAEDLRRRLGKAERAGGVIFGATAIPDEAWPESGKFHLTDSVEQAELAIRAARLRHGHWCQEMLSLEQHPIVQWLSERLLMLLPRGEAPCVSSPHLAPGEWCFCFIGQTSSRAGMPLSADAHAVSFLPGGGFRHEPLRDAVRRARLDDLGNSGLDADLAAGKILVPSAVQFSLTHLRTECDRRQRRLLPALRREERRLRGWRLEREELLERRAAELPAGGAERRRCERELAEIDEVLRRRRTEWRDAYFNPASEPVTRLVLAIAGRADGAGH